MGREEHLAQLLELLESATDWEVEQILLAARDLVE